VYADPYGRHSDRAGINVLIKHPNDIRSVLTSRNYTKETGSNRYFRTHVADGLLTAPPERHRHDRLVLNVAAQRSRVEVMG
jgi:cytochrome P450